MPDSVEISDEANEVVEFLIARPESFKRIVSLVSMGRDTLERLASAVCRDDDDIIRKYTKIITVIAETNINFTTYMPDSSKDRFTLINHLQESLPAKKPLPLIWPAKQGSASIAMANSTSAIMVPGRGKGDHTDDDDSGDENTQGDWSDDTEFENTTPDFINRLAVSRAWDLVYPSDLIGRNPASDTITTPWSYGTLYLVHYPESNIKCKATAATCSQLAQLNVSLPRVVLDLGRLVVTSDMEDNVDGRSWSPSDFSVMVDLQSETKALWLVCDRNVADKLSIINMYDGLDEDLKDVNDCFDSEKMDLALLFPRIKDWASCENSWSVIESRIRQSAMNLGLSLSHL